MARLSEADVERLLASLTGVSDSAHQDVTEPLAAPLSPDRIREAQQELLRLSADGTLGPLLTQRLAIYLNRPVRCTSGGAAQLADDNVVYVAQGGGVRFWLRIDALAASAIADAMIGGEGDGPKVGFGPRVLRLAAAALSEMLRGISAALQLQEPGPAALDRSPDRDLPVLACGLFSAATQTYGWQAGLVAAEVAPAPKPAPGVSVLSSPAAASSAARVAVPARGDGLEGALESARDRLQQTVRLPVIFEDVNIEQLKSPRIPQGWLRMSLGSRAGGAIILTADRETAAALVNCALAADVVDPKDSGALMEAGAEVILHAALRGFADALPDQRDELQHVMRLTDEAILAELPHCAVEHRVCAGRHYGILRWLIPAHMLRPRGATARVGRDKLS